MSTDEEVKRAAVELTNEVLLPTGTEGYVRSEWRVLKNGAKFCVVYTLKDYGSGQHACATSAVCLGGQKEEDVIRDAIARFARDSITSS